MCTLAIYRNASRRYPVILAANRDEYFNRPALPPQRLDQPPDVVAGRDLSAGGTWLASRIAGPFLVAGLLNRRSADPTQPSAPGTQSRGRLPLIAVACASVGQAHARVEQEDLASYGSFNLLVADRNRAVVLDNGGPNLRQTELGPGLSVLTNLDVNDPRCPRLATAYPAFDALGAALAKDPPLEALKQQLANVLANHQSSADPGGTNPFARLCIHLEGYGTRSSTIMVLQDDGRVRYLHAEGPPCRAPFSEVAY